MSAGTNWRAIATAPRDGTEFLVWLRAEHGGEDVSCCDLASFIVMSDGAYFYCDAAENYDHAVATHWMPLPGAPA